ncbi:MAG: hypothetical protein HY720_09170 [Planctomycetes bacterium]|nr:hypothetical protein [Planctomycetota bacterium]
MTSRVGIATIFVAMAFLRLEAPWAEADEGEAETHLRVADLGGQVASLPFAGYAFPVLASGVSTDSQQAGPWSYVPPFVPRFHHFDPPSGVLRITFGKPGGWALEDAKRRAAEGIRASTGARDPIGTDRLLELPLSGYEIAIWSGAGRVVLRCYDATEGGSIGQEVEFASAGGPLDPGVAAIAGRPDAAAVLTLKCKTYRLSTFRAKSPFTLAAELLAGTQEGPQDLSEAEHVELRARLEQRIESLVTEEAARKALLNALQSYFRTVRKLDASGGTVYRYGRADAVDFVVTHIAGVQEAVSLETYAFEVSAQVVQGPPRENDRTRGLHRDSTVGPGPAPRKEDEAERAAQVPRGWRDWYAGQGSPRIAIFVHEIPQGDAGPKDPDGATGDWLWIVEEGFAAPFFESGTRVVDRATILRLATERAKAEARTPDIESLKGQAEYLIEIEFRASGGSAYGGAFRAIAKKVEDGSTVAMVSTASLASLKVEKSKLVPGSHGYERRVETTWVSLPAATRILGCEIMDRMLQAIKH